MHRQTAALFLLACAQAPPPAIDPLRAQPDTPPTSPSSDSETLAAEDRPAAAGDTSGPGDTADSGLPSAPRFDGTWAYTYDYQPITAAPSLACTILWAGQSTLLATGCPQCDWAFSVDFLVDTANSTGEADCFGTAGAPDLSVQIGWVSDFYDGQGALYYEYHGRWLPAFLGTSADGTFTWSGGYAGDAYPAELRTDPYTGDYYYAYSTIIRQWSGAATITP